MCLGYINNSNRSHQKNRDIDDNQSIFIEKGLDEMNIGGWSDKKN